MEENKMLHLEALGKKLRLRVLDMKNKVRGPHIGSCFSVLDILVALYHDVMRLEPKTPGWPDRDRLILSKGHAAAALYAVLMEKGFITQDQLDGFHTCGGCLEEHPSRCLEMGIDVSTGSLGHGLSVGAGISLAGKVDNADYKTFVILSDGELNEGSVWEAVMFASHHNLNNLVAIIDHNKIQALGDTKDIIDLSPIEEKFAAFGWNALLIDGHDYEQLTSALRSTHATKPTVVVCNTVKGKGVSFMENELLWHYRPPMDQEYLAAQKELSS